MNELVKTLGPLVAKEVGPIIAKEGVNYISQKTNSPSHDLASAASANDLATIDSILAKDASINRTPALVAAAAKGRLNVLDILLNTPPPSDSRSRRHHTKDGETTLQFRKRYLDNWADGTTPLQAAVTNDHRKTAKLLLEAGAYPDICIKGRDTPLMSAAKTGKLDIVRLLLSFDADVDHRDAAGDTALIIAARTGHANTGNCLLQNGADIEVRNVKGGTPLLVASRHCHLDMIKMLLKRGADIDASDKRGLGVLHRAIEGVYLMGRINLSLKERTLRMLLDAGADTRMRDLQGKTPAQKAGWKEGGSRLRKLLDGDLASSPRTSTHGSVQGRGERRRHDDKPTTQDNCCATFHRAVQVVNNDPRTLQALFKSTLVSLSAMESQSFVHQPLNQNTDEIRLLNILPSEDPTSAIECQILHKPLYEALSYTWGEEDESEHIFIQEKKYRGRENLSFAVKQLRLKDTMRDLWNKAPWYAWGEGNESEYLSIRGKKYGVRENLWLALKQLRLERTTRCLWIDAICINQTNTAERNHQVDQMSLIFSQAVRVVVWLGSSTEESDDTLSFIARVNVGLEFDDYPNQQFSDHWENFIGLCKRPYWTRLWIIQEVALAIRIVLCCGSLEVDWGHFISVDHMVRLWIARKRLDNEYMPVLRTGTIPQRLSKIRLLDGPELPSYERDPHLLDLLFEFNESQCKDIKDRIFGLLSLASKYCRDSMPVDYSKSPFDVCQSALRHHLQYHCPEEDTAASMKLAYSANSVLQEEDSTFRQARVIYTIPFSTTLPEYKRPTSAFKSPFMQEVYLKFSLVYMGSLATNGNPGDIETAYRMGQVWKEVKDWDIQIFIHRLLCWYYGSPTRDGKPPTWSKKDTGNLQITLDENGFMAITNTNIHIGARLFDEWNEKPQSQFLVDKDSIEDLSYLFLCNSKFRHTT
ncbi:hypothetical protein HYALB_00012713 [Hymenoscyphus albidus]|uniref:Heterokaryon incompatibility domain-containing protein n=1 Tax=Hymenoscyphus albidus TaxID=595503 RepID=A0A9N9PWA5_9HELO|nr:hypothetical protein HYALB_00012713 [Hymenoscyphus albidus]